MSEKVSTEDTSTGIERVTNTFTSPGPRPDVVSRWQRTKAQLKEKNLLQRGFKTGICATCCCLFATGFIVSLVGFLVGNWVVRPYVCNVLVNNIGAERVGEIVNSGSNLLFRKLNFVDGLNYSDVTGGVDASVVRWGVPVKDEAVEIVRFDEVAGFSHPGLLDKYWTARHVPSWEEDEEHDEAVSLIRAGLSSGGDSFWDCYILQMEPRMEVTAHDELMLASWRGFAWFGYREVKYASNGDWGYPLLKAKMEASAAPLDALGPLMSETVFAMHLRHDATANTFSVDFEHMAQYTPMPGYAPLGGKATFVYEGGALRTTSLTYGGTTYTPGDAAADQEVRDGLASNKWVGWKKAEVSLIASLLAETNLVLHVKLVHLELAAAFQAVALKAFTAEPDHPFRRLLDPFIHRSIQVTNPNLDLLFDPTQKAAQFTLAPLLLDEQLKLLTDNIRDHPVGIKGLHMREWAAERGMGSFSAANATAAADADTFHWRWHYRALTVQTMYEELIGCWVAANYADAATLLADAKMAAWWADLQQYMPAISNTLESDGDWLNGGTLTMDVLVKVVSTVMVWVSWIHEDVGHAASYFVYNPTLTPMCVADDGVDGVPLNTVALNVNAYRTFVFLDRAKLLDPPPDFWFSDASGDRVCYEAFQSSLRKLGDDDQAFSECGATGFYSCVEDVETAVSS